MLIIPACALNKETIDIGTGLSLFDLLFSKQELKSELINWYFILSWVILEDTSKERLSEEETAKPKLFRNAILHPLFEEFAAL